MFKMFKLTLINLLFLTLASKSGSGSEEAIILLFYLCFNSKKFFFCLFFFFDSCQLKKTSHQLIYKVDCVVECGCYVILKKGLCAAAKYIKRQKSAFSS